MRLTYYLYLLAGLLLCAPVFAELPKPESFPLLSRSGTYHMEVPLDKQQRYWLHEKRELQLGASAPDYPPFDMTVSGQDLEGIMKQVERWYDVDVVFSDNSLKTQTFKGTISRFKKISQLLEVLESTGSVHFTMEGRRITAMK